MLIRGLGVGGEKFKKIKKKLNFTGVTHPNSPQELVFLLVSEQMGILRHREIKY